MKPYDIEERPAIGAYARGGGAKVVNSPTTINLTINVMVADGDVDSVPGIVEKIKAFFGGGNERHRQLEIPSSISGSELQRRLSRTIEN